MSLLRGVAIHPYHSTQRLALMHQSESIVDLVKIQIVSDVWRDVKIAPHALFHQARDICSALVSTESCTFPDTPRYKLKRSGRDFLASSGDTNDHRLTPTNVAALQSGTHDLDVASAVERVVHPTTGHLHDYLLNRLFKLRRIDTLGCSHGLSKRKLLWVEVHCENMRSFGPLRRLNDAESNRTQTKHCDGTAFFNFRRIFNSTIPS
mmetsp:Transcript_25307/g.55675  ORF Transcript_25307/g.55675 Transcript_25307/m.55675 type:complete len:207 (-) Transcript_25307:603-1223(-)